MKAPLIPVLSNEDNGYRPATVSSFRKRSFVTALGLSLMLLSGLVVMPVGLAQDIGPPAPEDHSAPDNAVTKAISHWFNKSKTNTDGTTTTGSSTTQSTSTNSTTATTSSKFDSAGNPAPNPNPDAPLHPPLLVQPPLVTTKVDPPQVDHSNPPILNHPKLDDPNNPLGLTGAEGRLKKFSDLVKQQRYAEARPGLFELRQSLVDLTEAHIELYKALYQIPSAREQAELEKALALEFAQLRDKASVESAKIYISEKDYPHAVKTLTEVVKSQPRSQLGLTSYAMLQEIGFTEQLQLAQ